MSCKKKSISCCIWRRRLYTCTLVVLPSVHQQLGCIRRCRPGKGRHGTALRLHRGRFRRHLVRVHLCLPHNPGARPGWSREEAGGRQRRRHQPQLPHRRRRRGCRQGPYVTDRPIILLAGHIDRSDDRLLFAVSTIELLAPFVCLFFPETLGDSESGI